MNEKLIGVLLGIAMIIGGIIWGIISMNNYSDNNELVESGEYLPFTATITEYEKEYYRTATGKRHKKCSTTYEYTIDNITYIGYTNHCYTFDPVGNDLEIYYNPTDPFDDFLKSETTFKMFLPFLISPIGVVTIYKAYKD